MSMTARHPLDEQPQPGRKARLACRSGQITGATANLASGLVQGNLAILPEKLAAAFHRFCQLNPKPCPIIGISEAGKCWSLPLLAHRRHSRLSATGQLCAP
jgi:uncharacterized protein YcsI (UPF0317 family)